MDRKETPGENKDQNQTDQTDQTDQNDENDEASEPKVPPLDLTEHSFASNGITISYYRSTPPTPPKTPTIPLIFVHDLSDDARCWSRVARVFAASRELILVDQRGHGRSDPPPPQGFTTDLLVSDMANLICHLNLPVKPVVIGHGMGAHVVGRLALGDAPLHGIVLEDPPWSRLEANSTDSGLTEHYNQCIDELAKLQQKTEEQLREMAKSRYPKWDEDDVAAWAASKLQFRYDDVTRSGLLPLATDWRVISHPLIVPTTLITSDKGFTTPEVAKTALRTMHEGEWVKIGGAGRSIRRDQYEVYLDAVSKFLNKI